jgi:PAS domain-containing protein
MDSNILQTSLHGVTEPVYIHRKGKFTYLNPAACRLFGVKLPGSLSADKCWSAYILIFMV